MIVDSDISVVVQGPTLYGNPGHQSFTEQTLVNARKVFPNCQLIFSTWANEVIPSVAVDIVLRSEDPGAPKFAEGSGVFNANRQITSTLRGLQAADRKYCLKLRSDARIEHLGFLKFFDLYPQAGQLTYFSKKILINSRGSFVPKLNYFHSCYWPNDWFQFGLREDVLDLWNIPLAPADEVVYWTNPDNGHKTLRYSIEQYLWLTFLRKHGPVAYDSMFAAPEQHIEHSECSIASNLVMLDPEQSGIHSLKYPYKRQLLRSVREGSYSHAYWRGLYNRYCCGRSGVYYVHKVFYNCCWAVLRTRNRLLRG